VELPQDEQQIARNVQALKNRLRGRGGRRGGGSSRSEKAAGDRDSELGPLLYFKSTSLTITHSSDASSKRKKPTKVQRKWGDQPPTESEMASLDFSVDKPTSTDDEPGSHDVQSLVDKASMGTRTREGMYEVKDWVFSNGAKDETDHLIARALEGGVKKDAPTTSGGLGALGSIFARLTGSKTFSEADLKPVLD
jgi:signal recognition particle receptor subunit alpha